MIARTVVAFAALLVIGACSGKPSTTPSPSAGREIRLLDAKDPALPSVLFAAAKYVFNPDSGKARGESFGGVYINKRYVPSLSNDIASYLGRTGWSRPKSKPADCDAESVARATPPRVPAGTAQTGPPVEAPNPTSQPSRTTAREACQDGGGISFDFTSVRIASDTAYVEIQGAGTRCLRLAVDQVAGGWVPADRSLTFVQMKTSKIGRCGR
jgi:hypothetical protein